MKDMNPVTSLKRFREAYRLTKQWERQLDEASALMAQFGMKYDFTRELYCSTMPGKILVAVPDINITVAAAGTTNGTGANKGTTTDLVLLTPGVITGTAGYTPALQGSNTLASGYAAVTPDKGAFSTVSVAGAFFQTVHAAQLQFQFYRATYTTGAATTGVQSSVFLFMPVEDSFSATVQ